MARRLRMQVPGAAYHVTSRGVRKQSIFRDDDDRTTFIGTLARVVQRHDWSCLAFCLMTTHYHLVIRTPKADLGAGMRRLNGSFAQGFNRRHGEVGHVFESRYHAVMIERDGHLLELYRYLALNPVRAGLCRRPERWTWGSYRAALGLAPSLDFVSTEWALAYFGNSPTRARKRFQAFVNDFEGCYAFATGSDPGLATGSDPGLGGLGLAP